MKNEIVKFQNVVDYQERWRDFNRKLHLHGWYGRILISCCSFSFFIEANIRFRQESSGSHQRKSWLQPYQKNAEYLKIKDNDFESASSTLEQRQSGEKKMKVWPKENMFIRLKKIKPILKLLQKAYI